MALTIGKIPKVKSSQVLEDGYSVGISDDNLLSIDSVDAASGEVLRLTANGAESRSEAEMKSDLNLNTITGFLTFTAGSELTISGGAVTATQTFHTIDTEVDAASDDLDTINGGNEGKMIIVRANNAARTVILKDATGNLSLAGSDVTLDDTDHFIILVFDSTLAAWVIAGDGGSSGGGGVSADDVSAMILSLG